MTVHSCVGMEMEIMTQKGSAGSWCGIIELEHVEKEGGPAKQLRKADEDVSHCGVQDC